MQTHWQCPNCDEQVDAQLESCWQCGCSREGEIDPAFKTIFDNQDQALCDHCGCLLFGYAQDQCPECGHDLHTAQMQSDEDTALPSRKFLLHFWGASWLFAPLIGIFCLIMFLAGGFQAFSAIFLIVVFVVIAAPILVVLRLIYDVLNRSNHPTDEQNERHEH